jgi:DsbC/DsbD-like thiol-disulfide interchange protein
MLIATVTPDASLPAGQQNRFSCELHWLVCQKVCLMGAGKVTLSLPSSADAIEDNRELFQKWMARIPTPAGHANVSVSTLGHGATQTWSGTIEVPVPSGAHDLDWFPGFSDAIVVKNIQISRRQDQAVVSFTAERIGDPKASVGKVWCVLAYTVADGSRTGVRIPVVFRPDDSAK